MYPSDIIEDLNQEGEQDAQEDYSRISRRVIAFGGKSIRALLKRDRAIESDLNALAQNGSLSPEGERKETFVFHHSFLVPRFAGEYITTRSLLFVAKRSTTELQPEEQRMRIHTPASLLGEPLEEPDSLFVEHIVDDKTVRYETITPHAFYPFEPETAVPSGGQQIVLPDEFDPEQLNQLPRVDTHTDEVVRIRESMINMVVVPQLVTVVYNKPPQAQTA